MSSISSILRTLFPWKISELRGLIIGNDASGKTTLLYKLKLGEIVTTIPTIGFNVETVPYKGTNYNNNYKNNNSTTIIILTIIKVSIII